MKENRSARSWLPILWGLYVCSSLDPSTNDVINIILPAHPPALRCSYDSTPSDEYMDRANISVRNILSCLRFAASPPKCLPADVAPAVHIVLGETHGCALRLVGPAAVGGVTTMHIYTPGVLCAGRGLSPSHFSRRAACEPTGRHAAGGGTH